MNERKILLKKKYEKVRVIFDKLPLLVGQCGFIAYSCNLSINIDHLSHSMARNLEIRNFVQL